MTNDKVNEVLREVITILSDHEARRLEGEEAFMPSSRAALGHCKTIAQIAIEMPPERLEKKFRWLGFIQGVLWAEGIVSLDQLKRANMPNGDAHEA